jgi:outer membrane protein TolC
MAQAKDINIALITDGTKVQESEALAYVRKNLNKIMSNPKRIKFKKVNLIHLGNDEDIMSQEIEKLMNRKDIDLVIALGGMVAAYFSAKNYNIKIPTMAAPILDNRLRTKKNLKSVQIFPSFQDVKKHLKLLDPGKKILLVGRDLKVYDPLVERAQEILGEDYEIEIHKVKETFESPDLEGIDFVVYFPFTFYTAEQFTKFHGEVMEKKIKTYSLEGFESLGKGVLYSTEIKNWKEKVARMFAINLMDFSEGRPVEKLKTNFLSFEKIAYSLDIAKKLGIRVTNLSFTPYEPSIQKVISIIPKLNLETAVDNAIEENLDYLVQKYQEKVADYRENAKLGKILPQINFNMDYNQRDPDRTVAFLGITERTTTLGVGLNQVILNDDIFSEYAVSGYMHQRRKYLKEQAEIDLTNATINAYLAILRAQSFVIIREENLRVTTENLDIATLKYKSGRGAKTEIYRWESEVAQNKNILTRSTVSLRNAYHLINKLMNTKLDKTYRMDNYKTVGEKLISDPLHKHSRSKEIRVLENYISFLIDESKKYSPYLKSLDETVKLQKRKLLNVNRSLYLPKIGFFGNYKYWIDRSGAGSEGRVSEEAGALWKNYWEFGLKLDFPIFTGTERLNQRKVAVNRLYRNKAKKSSGNLNNDTAIRDQVYRIRGAMDQVKYNREFEAAAKKNLDLVRISYKTGRVDILRLLDAQNFWIRAREALVTSEILMIREFTNLEDKVGYFWFRLSSQDKLDLGERFKGYINR